ncbi:SDR family NAD(P)-dependent oxidoreductase [Dactylosporangium sp. AC04546]|uniref:SDR family NAD(P)-dependent oxidoreductase n=1 Tax=Dactylosporangium sp. AC04546 TaxID=2862460 RepID=UPI001EDCECBC|nr:SDR family NAD(P)-dependent oxidoreductase [Dactylosporangium sp. AC04546]WVK80196.1 SDR family NAD(P)-dependent oxidoreductase [Dactylosporangium sp. AC04546]
MSKVMAVFGAGTGLGVSVARAFGRDGYRIALVARSAAPLEERAAALRAEGIDAAAFPADLADPDGVAGLVAAITARLGDIDVVHYGPAPTERFTAARELDPDRLRRYLDLYTHTLIALVQQVLPGMIDRGDGAILVTQGVTAVHPRPFLSGFGPAMAATRNWLAALHGEIAGQGVHVATLNVAAMIAGSEGHRIFVADGAAAGVPTVDPEFLAGLWQRMYRDRDRFEETYPAVG